MNEFQCTKCEGTGFLNLWQVGDSLVKEYEETRNVQLIFDWIEEQDSMLGDQEGCTCHICPPCGYCVYSHGVQVCDCCGNGENWYNKPGTHDWDNLEDPKGCR